MIEHAFTKKNLTKCIAYKDMFSDVELQDADKRQLIAGNAVKKMNSDALFAKPLRKIRIAGKIAYRFEDIEEELVCRLISKNLRSNYKIKPQNRHTIIKNAVSIIKEGSPYNLYRFDIQSFFEEICRDDIIKTLLADGKCARHSIVLLDKFFNSLTSQGISGLPRGVGISSVLAEFVLLKFDRLLQQNEEIFYYSRFVDDILIITSPQQSAAEINATVSQTLHPLKVHKVGYKSANIHVGKMHDESTAKVGFDYLGYKFDIFGFPSEKDKVMGAVRRQVNVEISETKVLKIKCRLIDSFAGYIQGGGTFDEYELLKNRLKALTGNYYITDPISGIPIKTGIFFNYSEKNIVDRCSLDSLDAFLRGLLYSRRHKLSKRIAQKVTELQRSDLIKYSFSKGFRDRMFHSFSHQQLRAIKEGWKK